MRLRIIRFRRSILAQLCTFDGHNDVTRPFQFFAGQMCLIDDWAWVQGDCVLQLIRPNGAVAVPANIVEWVSENARIRLD